MAEGLIPFIYRAIKSRRRRDQTFSRSLSTGSERWFGLPSHRHHKLLQPPAIKLGSFSEGAAGQGAGVHHRRHRSMEGFSAAEEISTPEGGGSRQAKEMVRFGSGRRVFSCITGAN
ncbi:uncharacterized protein LOC122015938 [Zingiber officinale]|uniref:uncharacterized protein LOC122015938 n=1 Tax=Zingiber officinale TaxID=94328 RepID=UPI001C4D9F78|nr:uncharacterized protein LOC122015938 [Zingiber officinale]